MSVEGNRPDAISYAYTADQLEKIFEKSRSKEVLSAWRSVKNSGPSFASRKKRFSRRNVERFLHENSGKALGHTIFHEMKSPYFLVEPKVRFSGTYEEKCRITTCPNLAELDFMKVIDPFTAHQEISQFQFGVLGCTDREVVEIGDKYKVIGKGFDPKYGFRHRPSHSKKQ